MTIRLLMLSLSILLLSACAGGPPPDPVTVHLTALNAKEKQRLYDGRHSSPPLLDVNRPLNEDQKQWHSTDLTWKETAEGWHARLRFISPDAKGLRVGLCVEPADLPMTLSIEESGGAINVPASKLGVVCENQSMFFLPLVGGDTITLRFETPPRNLPPAFDLTIHRVQHRGN